VCANEVNKLRLTGTEWDWAGPTTSYFKQSAVFPESRNAYEKLKVHLTASPSTSLTLNIYNKA